MSDLSGRDDWMYDDYIQWKHNRPRSNLGWWCLGILGGIIAVGVPFLAQ